MLCINYYKLKKLYKKEPTQIYTEKYINSCKLKSSITIVNYKNITINNQC